MDPLYTKAKELFPNASDDKINQRIAEIRSKEPQMSDDEILNAATQLKTSLDDGSFIKNLVNEDVKQKYGLAERQKIVDQNAKEAQGVNWGAGLAALGAGLQGGNAFQAGNDYKKAQQEERDKKLQAFDRDKAQFLADRDDAAKQEKLARELDPNSAESKMARELAIAMGMDPKNAEGLTASKFKEFSPALQKKYEISERSLDREARREDRREAAFARKDAQELRNLERQQRMEDKMLEFQTPYGLANTKEDAKQLKDAHESKANFDSKVQEMIKLREEYGGELLNREAVARGKQLSKDLLLEYKNMQKLGVLSQSDEKIINAIIPDDPLAFSGSSIVGQDPILNNLKKFQQDSDKDFANKVATRTREGVAQSLKPTKTAQGSGTVRMRDPKGNIRIVPKSQMEAALKAGGELIDESIANKDEDVINGGV